MRKAQFRLLFKTLYEGIKNIKNCLSCIGMSHVGVCAHVVMNAEHDCEGGDKECVVWSQYHL